MPVTVLSVGPTTTIPGYLHKMIRNKGSLRFLIALLLRLKSKNIFAVVGFRRSGNHAFISWLINALEESPTSYRPIDNSSIHITNSGKTIFINEVNMLYSLNFLKLLWQKRRIIRSAKHLIISAEDVPTNYFLNWRIPTNSTKCLITRDRLNIIASRYHFINQKALNGIGSSRMSLDSNFFHLLRELEHEIERKEHKFSVWNYDLWRTSEVYRSQFLDNLELHFDILPSITREGGGSSFGSNVPKDSERLSHVEPRIPFVNLLENVMMKEINLTPKETTRIQRLIEDFK